MLLEKSPTRHVEAEPKDEVEAVFRSWDLIHQPIRKAVKTKGADAQYALERHPGHFLRHVEVIEKHLARAERRTPGWPRGRPASSQ